MTLPNSYGTFVISARGGQGSKGGPGDQAAREGTVQKAEGAVPGRTALAQREMGALEGREVTARRVDKAERAVLEAKVATGAMLL